MGKQHASHLLHFALERAFTARTVIIVMLLGCQPISLNIGGRSDFLVNLTIRLFTKNIRIVLILVPLECV